MGKAGKNEQRRATLLRYAPLILWVGVIFFLSSGQGAMSQTSRFLRPLLEFLLPGAEEATLVAAHALIRKFAHFAEYFVLGLLASWTFARSSKSALADRWYLFAGALVLLIASTDEANQSFNPSRTGSPWDVLIDLSGGVTAIALWFTFRRRPVAC